MTEAVKCAQRQCVSKVVASNVIAAPHSETVRLVELSASRIARLQQAKEQKQKEAQSLDEQKEAQNQGQEPLAEQKMVKEQAPAGSEAPKADSGARPKSTRSRTRKAKEKQDSDESGTK